MLGKSLSIFLNAGLRIFLQYHQASLRPLGLMLLPQVSGAVLLKKATFSFLRPMEHLEHMTLCSEYTYKDQFVNFALLGEGKCYVAIFKVHSGL